MDYDVIIVGGSWAGLAAAMQLARARRAVCVIDSGRPRNRFATASHGVVGFDGTAPAMPPDRCITPHGRSPTG